MTSTTDTTGHPDVSEISDLTEGLLPPARTAEVRQHLDGCELCADVHASLDEIRGLLGAVPGPVAMPADVASRIDAALAAEALLNAAPPEAHVSRETSALPPSTLPPSASRPAGRPSPSTGPGRRNRGPDRGRRRRTVVLGAVLTAAVLGAGSFFLLSLGGNDKGSVTAQGKPTNSAVGFTKSTLQAEVDGLLGKKATLRGSKKPERGIQGDSTPSGSSATPYSPFIQPLPSVPPCVRGGISQSGDPLAAKEGTYEGKRVYLVVLPDAADSSRVTAFVVDADCGSSASPGKVLLTESLARP
ncbi:zf-HC2 domain-containing protein [Streptomyces sp. NPDC007162]|uniref:anti-sigma factor family protein n=1 Tax=Streptomyces sp. NPDC007162 TaxID=3156917 RepID=UPI0033BFD262